MSNDSSELDSRPHRSARKLLFLIFVLLPFVLLGLGYYLVAIPEGSVMAGISQRVWFGVGQSVLASALVGLVMLIGTWADRIAMADQSGNVARALANYSKAVDILRRTGIRELHEDRYIRPVYQRYQGVVSERLDILGMSLKHFQQDIGNDLIRWVKEREHLHVRIIVLNPASPYCQIRGREEESPDGEIAEWSLRITEFVLRTGHPRIKIRWHNTLPTVSMYRLDDVVFFGPYLIGRLSRLTTTMEADMPSSLAQQYLKHFENLWSPLPKHTEWSLAPSLIDVQRVREKLKADGKAL